MEIMRQFVEGHRPAATEPAHTLPSRKRLLKHLRARDADAAVAEMSKFLERLQAKYMDLWNQRQQG